MNIVNSSLHTFSICRKPEKGTENWEIYVIRHYCNQYYVNLLLILRLICLFD